MFNKCLQKVRENYGNLFLLLTYSSVSSPEFNEEYSLKYGLN